MKIADLQIRIGADTYELKQRMEQSRTELEKFGKSAKKLGDDMTKVGKSLTMKLTLPLLALGAASAKLYDTQIRGEAKVQQGIRSTAGAAKLSIEQLKSFASELQNKTIFGDERILNDATAQLLTFTNIAGENFKKAQVAALDFSTLLDGDLKSASIQLGKALNDPVKNLSALARSGIQFSKDQTAVIKRLAETNRLAEAQSLILKEINKQYGGQAEAAAKVGLGPLKQLGNDIGDLMEQFGEILTPAINKVAAAIKVVVMWMQSLSPEIKKIIIVISGLVAAIGPLLLTFGLVCKLMPLMIAGFSQLASPVSKVALALTAAATAASLFYAIRDKNENNTERFKDNLLKEMNVEDLDKYKKGLSIIESELEALKAERDGLLKSITDGKPEGVFSGKMSAVDYTKARQNNKSPKHQLNQLTIQISQKEVSVEAKRRAIEELEDQKREIDRVEKSIKSAMDGVKDSMNLTEEAAAAAGMIGKIKAAIEALEKKKLLPSNTAEDIGKINAEISKLQSNLEALGKYRGRQDTTPVVPTDITPAGGFDKVTVKSNGIDVLVANYKRSLPKLQGLVSEAQKHMAAINNVVANGVFGWADKSSGAIQMQMGKMATAIKRQSAELINAGWSIEAATEAVAMSLDSQIRGIGAAIENAISDIASSLGESIAGMITGDLGFDDLLIGISSQIGAFIKSLGQILIQYGTTIDAFKDALAAITTNPWVAIALGVAMVVIGTVMQNVLQKKQKDAPRLARGGLAFGPTYAMVGDNPNAGVDPEVIAPLSKLKSMMAGGMANVNITLSGNFGIKGRDIALALERDNYKISLIRG